MGQRQSWGVGRNVYQLCWQRHNEIQQQGRVGRLVELSAGRCSFSQAVRIIIHWNSTTGWAGYLTPSNEPFSKTWMQRLPCDSLEPSHQLWGNSFQQTEWILSTCDGSNTDCCALPVILGQESVLSWDGSAEGHPQPWLCLARWCLPCFNWRGTVDKIHPRAHGSLPQLGPGLFVRQSHSFQKGWGSLALETEVFCL